MNHMSLIDSRKVRKKLLFPIKLTPLIKYFLRKAVRFRKLLFKSQILTIFSSI